MSLALEALSLGYDMKKWKKKKIQSFTMPQHLFNSLESQESWTCLSIDAFQLLLDFCYHREDCLSIILECYYPPIVYCRAVCFWFSNCLDFYLTEISYYWAVVYLFVVASALCLIIMFCWNFMANLIDWSFKIFSSSTSFQQLSKHEYIEISGIPEVFLMTYCKIIFLIFKKNRKNLTLLIVTE